MLVVTFAYDGRGFPCRVEADGHADWAELGRDIVCAAVSTVLQSTWLGLVEVAGIEVAGTRAHGRLSMTWSRADREDAALAVLVKTADRSIAQLAAQYPQHVRSLRVEESAD